MNVAFIACEYNPFHNGHLYHINKTKEQGADAVICIMSGNFVQRGEAAIAPKHIRAKSALMNGADLVIELPVKYAVSDASHFAEGFIRTAQATGLDGFFSFGAKSDIETLINVKNCCFSPDAEEYSYEMQKEGISYPVSKAMYVRENLGVEGEKVLTDANNILALEYINNAYKFCSFQKFISVERCGADHDSLECDDIFASAGYIRRKIYEAYSDNLGIKGLFDCSEFIPQLSLEILLEAYSSGVCPSNPEKTEACILSRLLSLSADDFASVNNVCSGLENRIIEKIRISNSLEELYDSIKTKRFTHARIRQIILQAALGIKKDDLTNGVSYIRVLGFNENGRNLLRIMKDSSDIPVIMNLSQIDKNNDLMCRDAEIDYLAGKIFNICCPCPQDGNTEYNISPVIVG